MTYGFIGTGALAAAIVEGLCACTESAPSILVSPRNARVADRLARQFPSVRVADSNQAVLDGCTVAVLCVRPQDAASVLGTLRFVGDLPVISVMAGISTDRLRTLVAPATSISRAIPTPAVALRAGVTPVFPAASRSDVLFGALGRTIGVADEAVFDAFSAATATIAAHFAYLDRIAAFLNSAGVEKAEAQRYVAGLFANLACGLQTGTPDFARLARDHMTQGGINDQFLRGLQSAGMFDAVSRALEAVLTRLTGGVRG